MAEFVIMEHNGVFTYMCCSVCKKVVLKTDLFLPLCGKNWPLNGRVSKFSLDIIHKDIHSCISTNLAKNPIFQHHRSEKLEQFHHKFNRSLFPNLPAIC